MSEISETHAHRRDGTFTVLKFYTDITHFSKERHEACPAFGVHAE